MASGFKDGFAAGILGLCCWAMVARRQVSLRLQGDTDPYFYSATPIYVLNKARKQPPK